MQERFLALNSYLRHRFGCRVQKITLDAGLTCPNRDGNKGQNGCIYCNARGSGTGAAKKGLSITQQISQGRQLLQKRYKATKFIAYLQSFSNTYAPVSHLEKIYKEALAEDDIVGISIGTRPDCVDEQKLRLLQDMAARKMVWVEYGLQSAHDQTLVTINRGHDVECFTQAVNQTQGRGILICAHVILGLPGEDRSHIIKTADYLSRLPIDGVKLHLLYVARETGMEKLYQEGRYQCLGQREYVDLVCDFLERLPRSMVIHRLTGDPHPGELVAPSWAFGQKTQTLALIRTVLEQRDTWQGKMLEKSVFV